MASNNSLSTYERQQHILDFVRLHQRASVPTISAEFEISAATVRRDLEVLSKQGKVIKVHGGVIAALSAPPEPPIVQRTAAQADDKRRIGQAAAQLVADGETVFLGSGSTILEVARALQYRSKLTIITNSLMVINALAQAADITVIGLGGVFRPSEMSLVGYLTEQALAELRADKVIMGIRAIDVEHGLTNDYLPETLTDRAILRIGREVIIVADHTKCERVSTVFVAPLTAITTLVTDTSATTDFVEAVSAQGIRVITA
jgi:DeoR/GlpR family transcriptional regulator of sugar metabolism